MFLKLLGFIFWSLICFVFSASVILTNQDKVNAVLEESPLLQSWLDWFDNLLRRSSKDNDDRIDELMGDEDIPLDFESTRGSLHEELDD